ncbi:Detected protein of unknown function [Hibiscus syriacus]|uniref:H/ACA ribonucleoprotein complex non-core subunit NAF1 n=1 Tax=Hibiscus syriacus TaxID=106335 RepID=A0A6A2YJC3_HIBSY|nr:H/ACA ribonucleoprotein complex non-core subunit NAF1-like [Hibiscus syriacus]KAE8677297.1 Detected protein of unknown function [Hibiscus syriacus]
MVSSNLKEWFDGCPNVDSFGLEESVFDSIENTMEIGQEESFGKTPVGDLGFDGFEPVVDGSALVEDEPGRTRLEEDESKPQGELGLSVEESKPEDFDGLMAIGCESDPVGVEPGCTVKAEEESKPEKNPTLPIEEVIEKVGLDDGLESGSSSSVSDSESSSSSTSSSSSSDEEEEEEEDEEDEENKEKVKVNAKMLNDADELEDGEIIGTNEEATFDGTDNDDDDEEETDDILSALDIELEEVDDDEDAGASKGPIRSKHEVEVLPEVPPLDVELQPHHQMLPVGVILSMIGTKVIVEGREQHNPLNEGSVLWLTMNRSPLGFVDEIFGPVKNPYYIVRYNTESDVPAGIHEGTSISFVPEFANHVLNEKSLHKKGYDASGENDEELLGDAEFSDDEKEAEYKRMQKMTKRAMNDQRVGNQKSNKKKVNGAWNTDGNSAQQTATGQLPPNQNQHNISVVSASLVNHNCSSSVVGQQNFVGGSGFVPPSGNIGPSNGVWNNGMAGQHPQNVVFPNRFSAEGMQLLSQNYAQQPIPLSNPAISMPTMMPYQQQQQFDPSLSTFPNMVLPGGQLNSFAGLSSAPLLGIAGQNLISQSTFGMGMQSQQFLGALQSILTNGPTLNGNCNLQPKGVQVNFELSQNFNMGAPSSHGGKSHHRGRGSGRDRFSGGRGHHRSE